ncbi:hypothetical protein SDRG_14121 [Saprolegnia diclina VS20]|uniref:U-box domain-containing protein n=1 Tax=Saprolegnia diclina (strain VS20) TaxID=1156394 RepID=T0PRP4_SAPDV|nr:hypothetical protein SDRG_14121 [Saprolegnia diclina VS20]EQC28164.1 hypothetical protein SDRG_14121 [Saprolegnia diclina VS20]|eukprot:XP_008618450.1 hypothetical protein SDRG_14121 [Saprolegnia diclina VS20]
MTRHLDSFVCPITHDVMVDPVVTADGHSYERSAIEEWIRSSRETAPGGQVTSPVTNLPLRSTQLIPNLALKRSIGEYCTKHNVLPGSPAGSLRSPLRLAVVVPPTLALAPVDLPRIEALPQVGYYVYRASVTLAIYSQPSFGHRVSSAHGTALELPAGELFVVTKRLYSTMFGNTTGYVFLQLGAHNDVELRNGYVAELAEQSPHARLVERVPVTNEVAVYMADQPSPFYARPTTHSDSALVRQMMLRRDELVATDLRVHDPVSNLTYLRLDNSVGWLPLRHLTRYECTTRRLIFRVPSPTLVYRNIRTVPESVAVATLPADYLLVSTLHVYLNAFAYTRVVRDDVTGWCKLRLSDVLLECPPRLAEKPPGRSIPVALLQGDQYLVLLNEIQDDGSITQTFHCELPYAMLSAYTSFTLAQHWMGRTRNSIHPDYRVAFDMIALVPEILERSSSLVAMQRLDARLAMAPIPPRTYSAVVSRFTARCGLQRHVAQSLCDLVRFTARYGWSKYVVAALRDLTDRSAFDETIAITMHEVHEFMKMCDVAKMDAYAKVLDLVAADDADDVAPTDAVVAAIRRLRAPLLKAMRTRRDRAFDNVFLKPADFVLRANGYSEHRQRADDLRVHGSNMYRALLLSTLGINAWDTPDMDEDSHFAVDFLSYLSPSASPLATWWDPKMSARAPATTRITSWVDLDAAFIVKRNRPNGHVANHLIGPSSSLGERRRAAEYVRAYAAFFSRDVLDQILVNRLLVDDSAQSTEDRAIVLTALRRRGVATDADDAWTTLFYDSDYALRRDKVLAVFQFLGVYKCPPANGCVPMPGVALSSAYKP